MSKAFIVLVGAGGALLGYGLYRALSGGAQPGASSIPESDASAPEPLVTYGEPKITTPFPAGYRRLKQAEVTPALTSKATSIRNAPGFTGMQYGTVIPIGGATAALIEQHYHEPGGPMKPWGYHHGVTLIQQA
jgi:hypothetical protein